MARATSVMGEAAPERKGAPRHGPHSDRREPAAVCVWGPAWSSQLLGQESCPHSPEGATETQGGSVHLLELHCDMESWGWRWNGPRSWGAGLVREAPGRGGGSVFLQGGVGRRGEEFPSGPAHPTTLAAEGVALGHSGCHTQSGFWFAQRKQLQNPSTALRVQ